MQSVIEPITSKVILKKSDSSREVGLNSFKHLESQDLQFPRQNRVISDDSSECSESDDDNGKIVEYLARQRKTLKQADMHSQAKLTKRAPKTAVWSGRQRDFAEIQSLDVINMPFGKIFGPIIF